MQIGSSVGAAVTQNATAGDTASVDVAAKALQQTKKDGDTEARLIESAGAPGTGRLVNTYA